MFMALMSSKDSCGRGFLSRVEIKAVQAITIRNINSISTHSRYAEESLPFSCPIQFAG
jgi:hypothetical protein